MPHLETIQVGHFNILPGDIIQFFLVAFVASLRMLS